jgi:hypothetical protein
MVRQTRAQGRAGEGKKRGDLGGERKVRGSIREKEGEVAHKPLLKAKPSHLPVVRQDLPIHWFSNSGFGDLVLLMTERANMRTEKRERREEVRRA